MIKLFSICFVLIVFTTLVYSQKYSISDFQLKGPIHKLIEHEYESKKSYSNKHFSTIDTIIFRKDGSLKYNRRYRANGEILVEEKTDLVLTP